MRISGTAGSRRSRKAAGSIARIFWGVAHRKFLLQGTATRRKTSKRRFLPCSTPSRSPACIGSASPPVASSDCFSPRRIPDEIRGTYALDQQSTAAAIRAYGTGEWCRKTLGYRLDLDHASEQLREWCIAEMDKTRPDIAGALHECFEAIDTKPLLAAIRPPVLLLSGDKSRIASEQQKILAQGLPHGRVELFAGYGHGINLLQPERCARAALEFWRTVEGTQQ